MLCIVGWVVDVCVLIMFFSYGECVVLCLLDKNNVCLNLEDLGMIKNNCGYFLLLIRKFYGIILVIGFIGLGKSIMLYVGLSEINLWDCNILIVEDFIEFDFLGIG